MEQEGNTTQRKRSFDEADPEHHAAEPKHKKRRQQELEEEEQRDLPRPRVPEFLEKRQTLKLQRNGEDALDSNHNDVKSW